MKNTYYNAFFNELRYIRTDFIQYLLKETLYKDFMHFFTLLLKKKCYLMYSIIAYFWRSFFLILVRRRLVQKYRSGL